MKRSRVGSDSLIDMLVLLIVGRGFTCALVGFGSAVVEEESEKEEREKKSSQREKIRGRSLSNRAITLWDN